METTEPTHPWYRNGVIGVLLGLFLFSLFLAETRIYQVDEAQNVFLARILASHWEKTHFLSIELWHVWPLSWLAARFSGALSLLHAARLLMLGVYWVNIFLIALNCNIHWKSSRFLLVLLGAATLAPLWDYGFEVRHENILLLFFLVFLHGFRRKGEHPGLECLLMGLLAALMQFITFKSFAYWVPMASLFLVFPPNGWPLSRAKTFLLGSLGFICTAVIVLALLKLTGRLPFLMKSFAVGADLSGNASVRFPPWATLGRLLSQTPLLVGVAVAAGVHTLGSIREKWNDPCLWEGVLPETFLVLVGILALMANPAPHPYNLCLLVPFAYILGIRWVLAVRGSLEEGKPLVILWAGLVVFTHVSPFLTATLRHLQRPNDRQEQLVELAETMTDPAKDRVYDAAGLVSSRQSIGHQWFLHTLIMERVYRGQLPSVRKMLEEKPASVLIPNYRFSWLQQEDLSFFQSNYVALADDFLVLGQSLHGPKEAFNCLHPGRYFIKFTEPAPAGSEPSLNLDGVPIQIPSVRPLSKGVHSFEAGKDREVIVAWVGPTLNELPRPGSGDSKTFFFNWY